MGGIHLSPLSDFPGPAHFGEAFDPRPLGNLARYETHLDRKLQRILSMLLKLQELRCQRKADE